MKSVLVLMSTWNGERYLDAQLDSIKSQAFNGRLDMLVRDDGSRDGTLALLARHESSRVTVVRGRNIGAKASFFELLRLARDMPADYYALADQDDVWHPEKIARAVGLLAGARSPALYCSSLRLVDEQLRFMSMSRHPGDRSFASSLLRNFATGCTCVFDRAMLEAIRFPADAGQVLMHDWWLANSAAACGSVVYDDHSFIQYRQHAANQIGIATGLRGFVRRVSKFVRATTGPTRLAQARALRAAYEGLWPAAATKTLQSFIAGGDSITGRLAFVWTHREHIECVPAVRFVVRP